MNIHIFTYKEKQAEEENPDQTADMTAFLNAHHFPKEKEMFWVCLTPFEISFYLVHLEVNGNWVPSATWEGHLAFYRAVTCSYLYNSMGQIL